MIGATLIALSAFCPRELPDPAVSELGLSVGAAGLGELRAKVESRPDAECFSTNIVTSACYVADRAQTYLFTEEGAEAHPAVLFRGFEGRRLEQRGWYAGERNAALAWFTVAAESIAQPVHPDCPDP